MKRHSSDNDRLSSYRAEIDADDGLDPREFFEKENSRRGPSRKAQQLCAQVAETLQQVLGEARDAVIQSLQVVEVAPAPDASQLLVLVAIAGGDPVAANEASAALQRATGWLRSEVAAAITRKRAPNLVFRVVPAGGSEVQP